MPSPILFDASDDASSCFSDGGGEKTPSCTTVMDDRPEVVPWPGNIYMIQDEETYHTITVANGQLQMGNGFCDRGGFHWECVEKGGWLGFRNCVTGNFLGHTGGNNGTAKFHAKVNHHLADESFCARRHPDGGYVLLVRHGGNMAKMAVSKDGTTVVETNGQGTRWRFIEC